MSSAGSQAPFAPIRAIEVSTDPDQPKVEFADNWPTSFSFNHRDYTPGAELLTDWRRMDPDDQFAVRYAGLASGNRPRIWLSELPDDVGKAPWYHSYYATLEFKRGMSGGSVVSRDNKEMIRKFDGKTIAIAGKNNREEKLRPSIVFNKGYHVERENVTKRFEELVFELIVYQILDIEKPAEMYADPTKDKLVHKYELHIGYAQPARPGQT